MSTRGVKVLHDGLEGKEVTVTRKPSRTAVSAKMLATGLAIAVFGGCRPTEPDASGAVAETMEAMTPGDDEPIAADRLTEKMVGQTLALAGEVVKQCPSSGCWFTMKTDDGETFVDLNHSSIRLSERRIGEQAQVIGEVVKRGSGLALNAAQVEFHEIAELDAPPRGTRDRR